MLTEVQKIIQDIVDFIDTNNDGDFTTTTHQNGTVLEVLKVGEQPTYYHGYELFLMTEAVKVIGHELRSEFIDTDDGKQFVVNTDAVYDIQAFVERTNKALLGYSGERVQSVSLLVGAAEQAEFSIITVNVDGLWSRYDFNRSELIYVALHNLSVQKDADGVHVYQELIDMHRAFWDEMNAEVQE